MQAHRGTHEFLAPSLQRSKTLVSAIIVVHDDRSAATVSVMSRIFISYRREDSAGYAGRLFSDLRNNFGQEAIFMDVAGAIEPGLDFVDVIEGAVGSCDALVVMIGPDWQRLLDDRKSLEDSDDFVRIETATALRRKIRVVPVLVRDASMPAAEQLPDDLKPLARRQAIELSDTRWDYDVSNLVRALSQALGTGERVQKRSRWPSAAIVAVLFAVLVFAAFQFWPSGVDDDGPVVGIDDPSPETAKTLPREIEQKSTPPPEEKKSTPDPEVEKKRAATNEPDTTLPVPSVIGSSIGDAAATLKNAGLKHTEHQEETSSQRSGSVFRQSPAPGVIVKKGSSVMLTTAVAPEPTTRQVPSVVGKSLREADAALSDADLTFKQKKKLSGRPAGTVLSQNPKAGATIDKGASIELETAVASVSMPNFVGMSYRDAQAALRNMGLEVAKTTFLTLGKRDNGTVYNQGPRAKSSIGAREQVHLYVDVAPRSGDNHKGTIYLKDKEVFNLDAPQNDDIDRREDDIYFDSDSRGRSVLESRNGAMFAVTKEARRKGDCQYLKFSLTRIAASPGTVICVRTNNRRFGVIHVKEMSNSSPPELEISFSTWE